MQISELARLTGASTKAVRYYEDLGLLTADPRIGDVRGRGAMVAAEFVDPATGAPDAALTAAVAKACVVRIGFAWPSLTVYVPATAFGEIPGTSARRSSPSTSRISSPTSCWRAIASRMAGRSSSRSVTWM